MSAIEGELIHNYYLSPFTESYNGTKNSMDFIGFTFGGKHSTELGINRVSNGSRYTETLLPEFSNKTVNVPGANRVDYLGMEFTQKSFPLDIAFDSVTEEQLREMRRLFSTNKPLPLVFDESPYKTYYAKAANSPSLNYICFDEGGKRIYKGEGKIDLISFYPYGFCDKDFNVEEYDNKAEWLAASGLNLLKYNETELVTNNAKVFTYTIYNPGDYDSPFMIGINSSQAGGKLELKENGEVIDELHWEANNEDVVQSEMISELNKTVSGEIVGINDISNIEHEMGVKVRGVDDLTSVKVCKLGKNLLPFPYTHNSREVNGITFTVNGDGSVTVNGTTTTNTVFILNTNYICGDKVINAMTHPNGSTNGTYAVPYHLFYNNNNGTLSINLTPGTYQNETIYPQVELGTTATEYEPYIEPTEYTPDVDGVVQGVTSLYPSTTLMTDTDGAVIDTTYNNEDFSWMNINGNNQLIEFGRGTLSEVITQGLKKILKNDKIGNHRITSGNWFTIPKNKEVELVLTLYNTNSSIKPILDYKILYI